MAAEVGFRVLVGGEQRRGVARSPYKSEIEGCSDAKLRRDKLLYDSDGAQCEQSRQSLRRGTIMVLGICSRRDVFVALHLSR